VNLEDKISR